ncbi:hypothetical protein T439DRAFT_327971 [Meredithblackwellia eburnea MCA 4105]
MASNTVPAKDKPIKRPRTSTACTSCRSKRSKCDGAKPTCGTCRGLGVVCVYDLTNDRRKPFTKDVVTALQMKIDSLESQLAAMHMNQGSTLPAGVQFYGGNPLAPRNIPTDVFQGGLALNVHSELRFYGPTSSYRAVLAENSRVPKDLVAAARASSLTKAPIHGATPTDPSIPRRPPYLDPDFELSLVRLAFEYAFSLFQLVSEREFYADWRMNPTKRTANFSPFLFNVVLAIGSRYLDPLDPAWPREICSDPNDPSTRGDVYIAWSRNLIDQEWYHPDISTIRALNLLAIYLAGRGLDGPCWMFSGQSLRLCEDFGLHLGIHRLSHGCGEISDGVLAARRDAFHSTFITDVMLSMYIGRNITFKSEDIDQAIPPVMTDTEFDVPMHRSSCFHWATRLALIASKLMSTVYDLRAGISIASRQVVVPEIHLALETWYHELPSHLRATGTPIAKAPHPHIIGLNLMYWTIMIQLHRPFFRRVNAEKTVNVSTEKCLASAKHVVRLVKLQKDAHGLRYVPPVFQHACFCAGTILALSAVEDGLSGTGPEDDAARRAKAKMDLRSLVAALHEVGDTWRTAHTSATVLEALMAEWIVADLGASGSAGVQGDPAAAAAVPQIQSDSAAVFTFPFMFPSWDLPQSMDGSLDDFMELLNPVASEGSALPQTTVPQKDTGVWNSEFLEFV